MSAVEWYNVTGNPNVALRIYEGTGIGGNLRYVKSNNVASSTGFVKIDIDIAFEVTSATFTMRLTGAAFDWGISESPVYADGRFSADANWDAAFKVYTIGQFARLTKSGFNTSGTFNFTTPVTSFKPSVYLQGFRLQTEADDTNVSGISNGIRACTSRLL